MGMQDYEGYQALCVPHRPVDAHDALAVLEDGYAIRGANLRRVATERDDTFAVTASGRSGPQWILKIEHPMESREAVRMRAEALLSLQEREPDLPVTRILAGTDGQLVSAYRQGDESRAVTLTTFLPGQVLAQSEHAPTDLLLFAMGDSLARIQSVLARQRAFEDRLGRVLWDIRLLPDIAEGTLPEMDNAEIRSAVEHAVESYLSVSSQVESLPESMCHGDFHPGNLTVEPSRPNALAGIMDFGDMHMMPPICDVGTCLCYGVDADASSQAPLEACRRLLQGYLWSVRNDASSPQVMRGDEDTLALLPTLMEARSALALVLPIMAQLQAGVDPDHYLSGPQARLGRLNVMQSHSKQELLEMLGLGDAGREDPRAVGDRLST
ncbi:MAG: phosphotransferase [Bifidobacterium psychraerophilum]